MADPKAADQAQIIADLEARLAAAKKESEDKDRKIGQLLSDPEAYYEGMEYDVPKEEKDTVVAVIEQFQMIGTKRVSKPYVQKWNPNAWFQFLENREGLGYTIHEVKNLPKGAISVEKFNKMRKAAADKAAGDGGVSVKPR